MVYTLGYIFVNGAIQSAQHDEVSQYYFGYLKDAVGKFESAIMRLKHCENSQCDLADAKDMAHRIKGNAAMYGYTDLGLKAGAIEKVLREDQDDLDSANLISTLINFVDNIHAICHKTGKSEPTQLQNTLAIIPEKQMTGSQSASLSVPDRKSIILAYQDPWVSELIASLMGPEIATTICRTGEELRETALRNKRADLVILDHNFSGGRGFELLKEFKRGRVSQDISIFMAFDPDMPDAIVEAISSGADGFIEDKHDVLGLVNSARTFVTKTAASVLVVDDDPVVRDLLRHVLSGAGYVVDTVNDGLEALDYLSHEHPDLVLLDRFMPKLEGGTVLYEIQNKINLKSIPVLILTSMVNQGEAKSWFERGAADFIPKPFDPEEVVMRVKQHLETRQSVR